MGRSLKLGFTSSSVHEFLYVRFCGRTPAQVADKIEEWVEVGDVDGFNLQHYSRNNTFEDVGWRSSTLRSF